ncbi:MAG: hypothetical protein ACXWVD_00205 [Telluria sp.]
MKCGHCQHFDHATYPKMGTLGMGFCKLGAVPSAADACRVKVFVHWRREVGCGRGILLPETQRQKRRDWIARVGEK